VTNVVIIGGGPGGYEAALVASQLGADVTLIERDGIGGAAVLTDVVPSKALVAVAEAAIDTKGSSAIGVHARDVTIDIADVNARLKKCSNPEFRYSAAFTFPRCESAGRNR
jgi:dihydrolipoamide dehydrogenase